MTILIVVTFIGFCIYKVTTKSQEDYINSGEFKKRNPNIETTTKSNDQERNESMIRMANNMNVPIDEVKVDYIQDLRKNNISADCKNELLFRIKEKKIEESISFNISPQNTATAIMEEWLIEYFDSIDLSSEVQNFIKNHIVIFNKLKNNEKIELNEFFVLSDFLELEKTIEPILGIDYKNNINMDLVLDCAKLEDMEDKAKFFNKKGEPTSIVNRKVVEPKILYKIIEFGIKLESEEYAPSNYEKRSRLNEKLEKYDNALKDINKCIKLKEEQDWSKEWYYEEDIKYRSKIKILLGDIKGAENDEDLVKIYKESIL